MISQTLTSCTVTPVCADAQFGSMGYTDIFAEAQSGCAITVLIISFAQRWRRARQADQESELSFDTSLVVCAQEQIYACTP